MTACLKRDILQTVRAYLYTEDYRFHRATGARYAYPSFFGVTITGACTMEKRNPWPAILRLTRNVGTIVGCIVVLAGLCCLPLAAWRTFYHLGNGMMLLGGAVLLMGVGFPAVNTEAAGNHQHLMSTGSDTKRRVVYSMATLQSTMTMLVAGGVAALLGRLIQRVDLSVLGLI
jgi:hypothetical protein